MTEREKALEASVKELGYWLGRVTHGGKFNTNVARALERGRSALRMGKDDERIDVATKHHKVGAKSGRPRT